MLRRRRSLNHTLEKEIVIGKDFTSLVGTNDLSDEENQGEKFTPIVRHSMMRSEYFYEGFYKMFSTGDFILPPNCRYHSNINGIHVMVLEDTPRVRTIVSSYGLEATIEKLKKTGKLEAYGLSNFEKECPPPPYRMPLAFPYIVYVIAISEMRTVRLKIFYRIQPINSLSDYLLKTNLLNVNHNQVCLGDGSVRKGDSEQLETLMDFTVNIMDRFWLNNFNTDYSDHFEMYKDVSEVSDFLTWMYYSKLDPMFVFGVPWYPHNQTLGEVTKDISAELNRSNISNSSGNKFDNVINLFSQPIKLQTTDEDGEDLYENVVQETILRKHILSVGDEITYNEKTMYVKSFKGQRGGRPRIVTLEDEEDQTEDVVLTDRAVDNFDEQLHIINDVSSVEIGGKLIKRGILIKITTKYSNFYKRVSKIRKARDGRMEVKLGSDFYLLENVEFEVVDDKSIKVQGVEVNSGKIYKFLSVDPYSYKIIGTISRAKFVGFKETSSGDSLVAIFELMHGERNAGNRFTINLDDRKKDDDSYKFLGEVKPVQEQETEFKPIVRYFERIFTNHQAVYEELDEALDFVKKKCYIIPRAISQMYNQVYAEDNLLSENGSRLFIPSYDVDIDLKIGNPIVYCDWDERIWMTKVLRIKSFEIMQLHHDTFRSNEPENPVNWLVVKAETLNGKESCDIPFIRLSDGFIRAGVIRKVAANYRGWSSGDKVRCNAVGVQHFPKSSVHTIIGFLTDTDTRFPLILFSNLCSQWGHPDVMRLFTVYKRLSPEWLKFKNSLPPNRTRFQSGDMLIRNGAEVQNIRIVSSSGWGTTPNTVGFPWGGSFGYSYTIETVSEFKRYGVMLPRFTAKEENANPSARVLPNMHGGFIQTRISQVIIRGDLENVSSMDK